MPESISDLAATAAAHYRRRAQRAAEAVRTGQFDRTAANQALAPWLAIACLAGADLPQLIEPIAEYRAKDADGADIVSERQARALVAANICHRAKWAPILAKARDAALDGRHDTEEQIADARALTALANHFAADPAGKHHLPPYRGPVAQLRQLEAA